MKLDNLWRTERFHLAETGTDQAILGMPWLENFNPTINWTEGTIKEVLEVPLHLRKNKEGKKCTWKEGLLEEPTVIKTPPRKEDTDNMLITKLQEKRLESKEELKQILLQDYLEDLLCAKETQNQDPQERTASKSLGKDDSPQGKDQNNAPLTKEHCPELGIRPDGDQNHDGAHRNLIKLAIISPRKGEDDDA